MQRRKQRSRQVFSLRLSRKRTLELDGRLANFKTSQYAILT
jgi:hypothetical protein